MSELTTFLLQRLKQHPSAGTCPDVETLAVAADGPTAPSIAAHVNACERCRMVLELPSLPTLPCPEYAEWLAFLAQTVGAQRAEEMRHHAVECAPCRRDIELLAALPGVTRLLDVQSKLMLAGVATSIAAVLNAARRRSIALNADHQQRLHRSRERHLGTSASRPQLLRWEPFGQQENTYEAAIEISAEQTIEVRVHQPFVVLSQLTVPPGQYCRWSVTALRARRRLETRRGDICFIDAATNDEIAAREAELSPLPEEQRWLACGLLYADAGLHWEACYALSHYHEKQPSDPIGLILLGQQCEDMGRLQEAMSWFARASQMLTTIS
jgi:hypothetical protein